MVTNPDETEEEATLRQRIAGYIEEATRITIAGDARGAVRRIVLYVVIGAVVTAAPFPVAALGLAALLLLGLTDDLR